MKHSFRDAWCANESLVQFEPDETAKICAPWEKFCVVSFSETKILKNSFKIII